jgi:hypothetical protein
MLGTTASKIAVSAVLMLVPVIGAEGWRGSVAEVSPPPLAGTEADAGTSALLVATLTNGNVETHWVPRQVCERVVSELRAGSTVAGVTEDGTRLTIARANCSLRSAKLAALPPAL